MSTRTTGKRKTLVYRIADREWKHSQRHPNTPMPVIKDIRAELQRVARQVRKLRENRSHMECDYTWALKDVLDLLKEAAK